LSINNFFLYLEENIFNIEVPFLVTVHVIIIIYLLLVYSNSGKKVSKVIRIERPDFCIEEKSSSLRD